MLDRRVDLLMELEDDSIFHLEFQSANDGDMIYREGIYCALIANQYRRKRLRQVVLYAGRRRVSMQSRLELGQSTFAFELVDMLDMDSAALMRSVNLLTMYLRAD